MWNRRNIEVILTNISKYKNKRNVKMRKKSILGILFIFSLSFSAMITSVLGQTHTCEVKVGDQFIVEVVPESGRVVLPPLTVDSTFGNMGIIQFFLFPRSIVNCPSVEATEECLELFQGDDTYFLSVDSFPESNQVGGTRKFLDFDSGLGIFLPYET